MAKKNNNTPNENGGENKGFVNPFEKGVSYSDFLAAIPEGVSLKEYCKDNLTSEQIEGLEIELNHFEKNKS